MSADCKNISYLHKLCYGVGFFMQASYLGLDHLFPTLASISIAKIFRNRKEIQDKYCIRGAEWGVGDCSVEAMSPADRDNFIATLKQKLGDGAK